MAFEGYYTIWKILIGYRNRRIGMSQLLYAASTLSIPNRVIKSVQAQLLSFLWRNSKDKIKRAVM